MKKSALVYSKRSVQRERGKDQILYAKDGGNPIEFDSLFRYSILSLGLRWCGEYS